MEVIVAATSHHRRLMQKGEALRRGGRRRYKGHQTFSIRQNPHAREPWRPEDSVSQARCMAAHRAVSEMFRTRG
jgi:hypothetical protein